jgi:hypothetical protein
MPRITQRLIVTVAAFALVLLIAGPASAFPLQDGGHEAAPCPLPAQLARNEPEICFKPKPVPVSKVDVVSADRTKPGVVTDTAPSGVPVTIFLVAVAAAGGAGLLVGRQRRRMSGTP